MSLDASVNLRGVITVRGTEGNYLASCGIRDKGQIENLHLVPGLTTTPGEIIKILEAIDAAVKKFGKVFPDCPQC